MGHPSHGAIMTTKTVLDKGSRVVLPKLLRNELQLGAGDSLQLESHGERITLRPLRATMPIRKEDGVWVYRSGHSVSTSIRKMIEEGREERHRATL
jgi:AbrB family looped-hinge helix DNA binding protein